MRILLICCLLLASWSPLSAATHELTADFWLIDCNFSDGLGAKHYFYLNSKGNYTIRVDGDEKRGLLSERKQAAAVATEIKDQLLEIANGDLPRRVDAQPHGTISMQINTGEPAYEGWHFDPAAPPVQVVELGQALLHLHALLPAR